VKQAADLLRASKTGVNLSVFPPDADRQNTQISPRVFDLLASGCVLVTEDVPLAAETLKNLHYHVFMDKEEAGRRITEILADGEREKKFFDPNRATICREHTYANRAKEIIAYCCG
jgi:spore maturation protein CgeB